MHKQDTPSRFRYGPSAEHNRRRRKRLGKFSRSPGYHTWKNVNAIGENGLRVRPRVVARGLAVRVTGSLLWRT
jgi:hypothetical protein